MKALIFVCLLSLSICLIPNSDGFLSQPSRSVSITPQYFDLREIYYSYCKFYIYEQGVCTGNWAISVSDAISDLLCIAKKSKDRLSTQQLLNCVHTNVNTCKNSTSPTLLSDTLNYVKDHGLTTSQCISYSSALTGKPGAVCGDHCDDKSEISKVYNIAGYKKLNGKDEIKEFILRHGSVVANIEYYSDLLLYTKGIYTPNKKSIYLGTHTVKLVGWNVEDDGDEFWIAANSFGINWGMTGYFNILTDGDSIIEAYGIDLA